MNNLKQQNLGDGIFNGNITLDEDNKTKQCLNEYLIKNLNYIYEPRK